ncbi:response regulator [Myxococcota bacterium]|nr:response regulator [Myxococcota bacterium]MBU1383032.1 response regulator [Myxococcota bacterium]MBU1497085.1 response regulator [Myxococcota bacterium]
MSEKILFVDDEQAILDSFRRQYRKSFDLDTACGPMEGLEKLKSGDWAVIVSDLRMPGLDGIQFLSKVKATNPDIIRIMLTGNADVTSAIQAINDGEIFRFLTKPVSSVALTRALYEALRLHKLVIAERELLEETLRGSISVLSDLNALINPEVFGRSSRSKRIAAMLGRTMKLDDIWKIETAAMLSLIGTITVSQELVEKWLRGDDLDEIEAEYFSTHCQTTSSMIAKIPRMNHIANIIKYQEKNFDGSGFPRENISGLDIPIESRILRVVNDFDRYSRREKDTKKTLDRLLNRNGKYDPTILGALQTVSGIESKLSISQVSITQINTGDIFVEELRTDSGVLLVSRGQQITELLAMKIRLLAENRKISQTTVSIMKSK